MRRSLAIVMVVLVLAPGCATALRRHENGSASPGINVVVRDPDAKILVGGKELSKRVVYDGRRHGSSFHVFRVFPPGKPGTVELTVRTAAGEVTRTSKKHFEGLGWFMVSGLWFLIDLATGALSYYDDVRVD